MGNKNGLDSYQKRKKEWLGQFSALSAAGILPKIIVVKDVMPNVLTLSLNQWGLRALSTRISGCIIEKMCKIYTFLSKNDLHQ